MVMTAKEVRKSYWFSRLDCIWLWFDKFATHKKGFKEEENKNVKQAK